MLTLMMGAAVMACSGGDKPGEPSKPPKEVVSPLQKPASAPSTDKPADTGPADKPAEVGLADKPADAGTAGGGAKSWEYIIEMESPDEGKMRMEVKAQGKDKMNIKMLEWENGAWKDKVFMITDGTYTYMLDSANKSGMKMPQDKETAENAVPEDMLIVPEWSNYKDEVLKGTGAIEKAGEEEIGGVKTTKYKVKGLEGSDYGFVYVDDKDVMRKIEAFGPDNKLVMSMTFVKVELNVKFADSDFAPPPDYNIMDMSNMMKDIPSGGGMPPMPEGPK
jgi:outer membrane lipoprotein-sorting protein